MAKSNKRDGLTPLALDALLSDNRKGPPQKVQKKEPKPDLRINALSQRFRLGQTACQFIQQNPEIYPAIERIHRARWADTYFSSMARDGDAFVITMTYDRYPEKRTNLLLTLKDDKFTYAGDKESYAQAFQNLIESLKATEVQPSRNEIVNEPEASANRL